MPICEVDPWRMQYFAHVACPADVLISTDLLECATLPAGITAKPLPTLTVRGRAAPLGIAALQRVGASS